jgi:membrane associated rhomboid family serine protease
VSYLLIGVNVMVFVAGLQVASRRGISSQDFLWLKNPPLPAVQEIQHEMGALTGGDLVKGEWYRLLTCCFVHFGLIHLGVNMWSLYMIGPFLEGLWGRGRFLFLYIAAGLAGSCAMALASPPTAEGAGASGAIWGIFTSLIPWILLNRRYLAPHWASTMLRRLAFLIVLNVGISMMPGISAAAHFGGGAMGVIAAVALNENRFGRSSRRWLAGLAALALPCVCVAGLVGRIQYADRDTIDFNERLSRAREAVEGAEEIAKQEFDPLLRQPLKVRATEEVESATAAIRQLLDKLDVSFDVLKNAGPYRDPQIETERWSFLEKIQAQRDYYTGLYLQTFLIPAAQDAARTGVGAYLEVADGLETLGPRVLQQPARVTACEHMEMARAKMLALVQFDEKLGSVENPRLEKIRSALGQRLEAQAALLNFTESFLKRNDDWSDTNKRQYARLKHEFKSAEDRWKTALAK